MLSLGKVKSSNAAASYYAGADDYYLQDRSPSTWSGNGAALLGLSGPVDPDKFRDLLDGKMPDGSQIQNAAEGRRAGTDFTFSAPKSVSLQALIGCDRRLIDAHEAAVSRAMDYVERNLAAYRETHDGRTVRYASDNLTIAQFRHDLSRDADPHLHTHAVVINVTQRPDGAWRALEQTDFYRQKMLVGALYRSELALEVQKLGYEIRTTHVDGRFELAHFNQTQIDAFSTRSQAIKSALEGKGLVRDDVSSRYKEVLTLTTRDAKQDLDRAALRETWTRKSAELGVDYSPNLKIREYDSTARSAAGATAVTYAVQHTTERQAIVTEPQILRAALEQGTGQTDLAAIKAEIGRQTQSGRLIESRGRFTTETAQQLEAEMLGVELRGRGAVAPVISREQAGKFLDASRLNDGQRAAGELILSTNTRVVAVQGMAGTGKTTMLAETSQTAKSNGYQVLGLAPSAAAARELAKAGIEAKTLASFAQQESSTLNDKSIVVLDEAGMVSANDMHMVLHRVEAAGARIVLLGDEQQLKAVEAGRPFAQLQEAGVARVEMSQIVRQSDGTLRHAVELAARGEVGRSIDTLSKHVIEIDAQRDRYAAIAKDYAFLPPVEREQTLIVAGTNYARAAINENVRVELGLAGRGIGVTTLERKDLTNAQARMSASYQPGDMVQALKSYPGLGLARGDLARVVDAVPGQVTLERPDGVQVSWQLAVQTNLTAFREQAKELAVGDAVRFTVNDYGRGVVNGDRAVVRAIDAERGLVTLAKGDGKELTLETSKPLHLDYGYASTVHAAQGQTVDRVLVEADTRSLTANESSYYVAISRAREGVTIYTDDKAMLPEAMGRESVKDAALDLQPASAKTASVEMER